MDIGSVVLRARWLLPVGHFNWAQCSARRTYLRGFVLLPLPSWLMLAAVILFQWALSPIVRWSSSRGILDFQFGASCGLLVVLVGQRQHCAYDVVPGVLRHSSGRISGVDSLTFIVGEVTMPCAGYAARHGACRGSGPPALPFPRLGHGCLWGRPL